MARETNNPQTNDRGERVQVCQLRRGWMHDLTWGSTGRKQSRLPIPSEVDTQFDLEVDRHFDLEVDRQEYSHNPPSLSEMGSKFDFMLDLTNSVGNTCKKIPDETRARMCQNHRR